jgi:hypothetical protein
LAAKDLGYQVEFEWIATTNLEQDFKVKLANYQALWTVPASPYASSQHPFFVGTLFQPERSAFKQLVHPLIKAFLQAAAE